MDVWKFINITRAARRATTRTHHAASPPSDARPVMVMRGNGRQHDDNRHDPYDHVMSILVPPHLTPMPPSACSQRPTQDTPPTRQPTKWQIRFNIQTVRAFSRHLRALRGRVGGEEVGQPLHLGQVHPTVTERPL
jgi:hypothetical protein